MSQNKILKPAKTKAEFIAENLAHYSARYSFLPPKQIRGKLEEDWKKIYGLKRVTKVIAKTIPVAVPEPKPTPKVTIKPEILITPVATEQLKPQETSDDKKSEISKDKETKNSANNDVGNVDGGDYADNHDNQKQIKRKLIKEDQAPRHHHLRSKKDKLETTIELLSDDNKSIGFIESKGSDTYLKLHNGKTLPWFHSTPVRVTRNNTHFKEISRLPFSPI